MGFITLIGTIALALQVALWLTLRRKIDAMPQRFAGLVRRERIDAAEQAQTLLQEATAAKIGPLVSALRIYHDQMRQDLQGQLAQQERRRQDAEGRVNEAGAALAAALTLLRELRAALDRVAGCSGAHEPSTARPAIPAGPDTEDERRTFESPPPAISAPPGATPDDALDDDDDKTVIAARRAIPPPPLSQRRAVQQEA